MKGHNDPRAELESRLMQKDTLRFEAKRAHQRGETCSFRALTSGVRELDESIRSLRAIIKAAA